MTIVFAGGKTGGTGWPRSATMAPPTPNIDAGGDPVHFLMAEDLVHERENELHHGVRSRPPSHETPSRRPGTRKQQFGWRLVEVGLKLAVEDEDRRN
ncbi:hypothetical protein QRX60_01610 [Amycolatopsis mongoliensis]|uniref:Uncharacterized protein n=1 Tax=Amycolatopsis mongoliensis TaxID=715475 RepID=A0A9Y2NEC1_9PSEU|nr:hypothetical protein [Amycolatopsis sp. 4-36]WIY02596.1 hypothetical protein QRX60_01610 [Amycolatopsis sp. 4-36]